jgi:hypothetical protein
MCCQQHRGKCHQGDKILQATPQGGEIEQCHLERGLLEAAVVQAFEVCLQGFQAVVLLVLAAW